MTDVLEVTITHGAEKFQSVQYHSFEVGQISVTFKVSENSDLTSVIENRLKFLRGEFEKAFKLQLDDHINRIRETQSTLKEPRK